MGEPVVFRLQLRGTTRQGHRPRSRLKPTLMPTAFATWQALAQQCAGSTKEQHHNYHPPQSGRSPHSLIWVCDYVEPIREVIEFGKSDVTSLAAVWTTRSRIVGMPSGRHRLGDRGVSLSH